MAEMTEKERLKREYEKALAKKAERKSFESAMNAHSLQQKKLAMAQAGEAGYETAKLTGVDPSEATAKSAMGKLGAAKTALEAVSGQSVGDMLGGGEGGGAASGAMSGAQAGFKAFGPKGAIIGGIAGAVMGAGAAREKRKAHNRMIEAKKQKAMGEIAMEEGRQIGQALAGMGTRIGASLR